MAPKYVPTDTITWSDESVTLSQLATVALLEFASDNEMRTHFYGVGISDGHLAATDGHTLLRYDTPKTGKEFNHGKVWSRSYVEMALAVAKLEKRDVVLKYDGLLADAVFPPVAHVVPEPGFGKGEAHKQEPVAVNPGYLARMVKVCKALGNQGCQLTSMRGELDPIMYQVAGCKVCDLQATIVIMPMRY